MNFFDPSGHVVTQADIDAKNQGLISDYDITAINDYTQQYNVAEQNNNYAYMNNCKLEVMKIRSNYTDINDDYDYTQGGVYSEGKKDFYKALLIMDSGRVAIDKGIEMVAGSISPAGKIGEIHHIASNKAIKSGFTEAFKKIFNNAGMTLEDAANKILLPGHSGGHTNDYKKYVLQVLKAATEGATGQNAKDALTKALNELKDQLINNPGMPYKGGLK